jgi:hypothetical protein
MFKDEIMIFFLFCAAKIGLIFQNAIKLIRRSLLDAINLERKTMGKTRQSIRFFTKDLLGLYI